MRVTGGLVLRFLYASMFLAMNFSANGQTRAPIGAWASMGHWEAAPKDVNPDLRAAGAQVLYFESDGTFTIWSGTLYSENHRSPTISAGDGESLFTGTWKPLKTGAEVRLRKVYSDVRINGETFPGPEQMLDTKWVKHRLRFRGYRFQRLASLDRQMMGYARQAKGMHPDKGPVGR